MSLDLKRKKVELSRVRVAKEELLLKIEEKMEEIERLKQHVEIQIETEKKLEEIIKNLS